VAFISSGEKLGKVIGELRRSTFKQVRGKNEPGAWDQAVKENTGEQLSHPRRGKSRYFDFFKHIQEGGGEKQCRELDAAYKEEERDYQTSGETQGL